jgi:hypothetical protein
MTDRVEVVVEPDLHWRYSLASAIALARPYDTIVVRSYAMESLADRVCREMGVVRRVVVRHLRKESAK